MGTTPTKPTGPEAPQDAPGTPVNKQDSPAVNQPPTENTPRIRTWVVHLRSKLPVKPKKYQQLSPQVWGSRLPR